MNYITMEHAMTEKLNGKPKEYQKSYNKNNFIIDKGRIITAIVCLIAIFTIMLGLFYLADVFK